MAAVPSPMQSEEDFLISKVMEYRKSDIYAAKSWMIFTKLTLPDSFRVMFLSYTMECEENKLAESAICLSHLIKKFPTDSTLVSELQSIADALATGSNAFLRDVFQKLPEDVKYDVLIILIRNATCVEVRCQLKLLFLNIMPNSRLLQHGCNIVETLVSAEDRCGIPKPVNLFRKMLVLDALPLVLRLPQYQHKSKLIFQVLQRAVEFYMYCIFIHPNKQDPSVITEATFLHENNGENGWKSLLKLFEGVALQYKWNYPEMYSEKYSELSLYQLLTLLKRKNKMVAALINEKGIIREEIPGFEEAYFSLAITFCYYLYKFGTFVHPNFSENTLTGPFTLIAVEGITFLPDDCPKSVLSDFTQTERGYMTLSKFVDLDAKLLFTSFLTATECWDYLHHHEHSQNEFKVLCSNIEMARFPAFQEFFVNSLFFNQVYKEVIDHFTRFQKNFVEVTQKDKIAVQLASAYYSMNDYDRSLNILIELILKLKPVNDVNTVRPSISKCSSRFMYYLAYNNSDILQYCISILLKLYKSKEKINDAYRDMALGYMLILMQYNLENEYALLNKCIETIKEAKTFHFPKFFKYVINVVILEEISYLNYIDGINLEILPETTQSTVNRGNLKQAFENQMARCYDNLDNLFIEFFKEEHTFLLLPLNA